MHSFSLNSAQRHALVRRLRLERDAKTFRRILALLELDRCKNVSAVATMLHVDRGSIYDWIDSFRNGDLLATRERLDDSRGRPSIWEDEDLDRLLQATLEYPPEELGYAAMTWTVPLLQQHLSSYAGKKPSETSLRRHLRDLGFRWKRPRYELVPDSQLAKKSG